MANSVDPDQTAPSRAVWSGSVLFAYVILSDTLVFEILGHLLSFLLIYTIFFVSLFMKDSLTWLKYSWQGHQNSNKQ